MSAQSEREFAARDNGEGVVCAASRATRSKWRRVPHGSAIPSNPASPGTPTEQVAKQVAVDDVPGSLAEVDLNHVQGALRRNAQL